MANPKETAHAIKQCLIYLMDDAVLAGMDGCAFHMALALQEAELTLGQKSDIANELAKKLQANDGFKHTH